MEERKCLWTEPKIFRLVIYSGHAMIFRSRDSNFPNRSVHLRANDFVNLMMLAVVMAFSGDAS
jgi:hypothetical protein